jgi:hypothetical protein
MQLIAVVASILHAHNVSQLLVYRNYVKGRKTNMPRNRVGGHLQIYEGYFTNLVFLENYSGAATGCQGIRSYHSTGCQRLQPALPMNDYVINKNFEPDFFGCL